MSVVESLCFVAGNVVRSVVAVFVVSSSDAIVDVLLGGMSFGPGEGDIVGASLLDELLDDFPKVTVGL